MRQLSNTRGSVELLLSASLLVIALAVCTNNELAARKRIQHFGSAATTLTGFYVGEFTLVHVITAKKVTGRDICPNPARGCAVDFNPNARLKIFNTPSLLWAAMKLAWNIDSAHAGNTDANTTRTRRKTDQDAAGVGEGTGGPTASTPLPKGNFPIVRAGSVRILAADPTADGRFVCSVYDAPDGRERQLCLKETPRPNVTLLVNGSAGPLANVPTNTPLNVSYTVQYAESCELSVDLPVSPAFTRETVAAVAGTRSVSLLNPLSRYLFSLTCRSAVGSTTSQVQVNTTNHTPRLSLSVNGGPGPASAEGGTTVSVTWSTQYCNTVALTTTPGVLFSAQPNGTNVQTLPLPANQKISIKLGCSNEAGYVETFAEVNTYRKIPIYRAYNPIADCHFYTAQEAEYRAVTQGSGYLPEGVRFFAYDAKWKDSIFPIRRFYNTTVGCHYYTMNNGEADTLINSGAWREETQLAFGALSQDAQVPGAEEVFHLYNQRTGSHIFTANEAERSYVLRAFGDIWVQHASLGFAIASELPNNALAKTIPIYRAFNPNSSQHFFTQNCAEYQAVVRGGWSPEGIQLLLWEGPLSGAATKARRYRSSNGASHLYTIELKPEDGPGWVEEPFIGYVTPYRSNTMAEVFHFKNVNGNHLYTTNRAEVIDPNTNQPRAGWSVGTSLGWAPVNGDRVECPVAPQPPLPVSVSLLVDGAVNPPTKKKGSSFTVTWSSLNATRCDVRFGSRTVSNDVNNTIAGVVVGPVMANDTVTLDCSGPGGSAQKRATVTVRDPVPVYLNSPRCTDGRAPFESDTPQDFGSCTVSFNDDCSVQKDGAQWGYTSRPGNQAQIDAETKNLIQEFRVGTCRGTSCTAQGGWDRGTYQCDGKARVVRYR